MNAPQGYFFTKEHEWVKLEGKKAKIGITEYAQHKLGDITYVEPAVQGKQVKQGDAVTGIESVKAASDVFAPISGKILSANPALESAPELVNKAPYTDGWIAEMEAANPSETSTLMDAAAYTKYTEGLEK